MKRLLVVLTLLTLALLLVAAAGCGGGTTIKTPEGEVKVGDQGGKITINEGGESATLSQSREAPTEAELGIPIYPGSTFYPEDSGRVDLTGGGGQAYVGTAVFLTGDGYDKVVDWYTGKIGAPQGSTSSGADWLVGDLATGNYSAMHIEKDGSQVRISITHMAAAVP